MSEAQARGGAPGGSRRRGDLAAGRGGAGILEAVALREEGDGLLLERLTRAVEEAVSRGQVPGAVVLVGRKGRVAARVAGGLAQAIPRRVPARPDTVYDLASLTKPLATAAVLMTLVRDRRVELNDRVAAHWPPFGSGGKARLTIRDLATHTGGLDDGGLYDPSDPMVTTARVREWLEAKTPSAPPGTVYRYADVNYIALGLMIEAVTGTSLARSFRRRIAAPLGLKDTGFLPPASLVSRIAATAVRDGRMLRGSVHDPRSALLGGVAGHAGLFGTAREVHAVAASLLGFGRRLLPGALAETMIRARTPRGLHPRGIGWDTDPEGRGPRGCRFPRDGFGHTGFTGTSVWADPGTGTVVVVLTNRVHPDGGGDAGPLRRRAADLAAGWAFSRSRRRRAVVLAGIDVLADDGFLLLRGRRIGVVTNRAATDREGRRTLDVLADARGVSLEAVFSPEHGLEARLDGPVPSGRHERLGVPVHSLYGERRRPRRSDLAGLDALVIDLPDVGARFYTYHATMAYALEEAARAGIEAVVLDRPNPLGGVRVEGPCLPPSRFGFTGYSSLPVRHGMTMGEMAGLFNATHRIGAKLTVVPASGWRRTRWFDETGLPWSDPSPNLRSLTQAILYPAIGLLEATPLSVGRGTDGPFERFGAPSLDAAALAEELSGRRPAGVRFLPLSFVPASGPFAGVRCRGCAVHLLDRRAFEPVRTGIEIAAALFRTAGGGFDLRGLDRMIGTASPRRMIGRGVAPDRIAARWKRDERAFLRRRRRFLLYA